MRKALKTKPLDPETKEARLEALYKRRAELDEQMAKYRDEHKIEFFKPIEPYQSKVLEHLHAGKKIIMLQGGNGIGKTVLGSVIVGSGCLGIQPWDKQETIWGRRPVKVRILCTDWEKHAKTVIVPKLQEWFPVGQYTTSKNNVGVESVFKFKNGSSIELMTNKEDTKDHEGWEGDIVWADEPPPRDKFVANLRGLRKSKKDLTEDDPEMGVFLLTLTAVSEAWMLDEIVRNIHKNYASVTEIPMSANPYLSKDYQETFAASLKAKERMARIEGKWLNLVGLVWPSFNPEVHIIDPFDIPTDWPVVPLIDHHPSHPNALSYFAYDPFGRIFVIDETWGHMSAEQEGDDIIRHQIRNAWRIKDAFIDPLSKGDAAYVKNMGLEIRDTFSILKERLWHHGVELHVASKDRDSGLRNVEKMLEGPNKTPILFFFRSLDKIQDEGHIWEIQRWTYDDNNKPRDENDHFMGNIYRATLTGTVYTKPRRDGENLKSQTEFDVFQPGYGIREESQTEFNVWR